MAVGQHQWYHFGIGAPILIYSGDWDVHWGITGVLTRSHLCPETDQKNPRLHRTPRLRPSSGPHGTRTSPRSVCAERQQESCSQTPPEDAWRWRFGRVGALGPKAEAAQLCDPGKMGVTLFGAWTIFREATRTKKGKIIGTAEELRMVWGVCRWRPRAGRVGGPRSGERWIHLLWVDGILQHVETMENHCLLAVVTGESSCQGFLGGAAFRP